MGCGSSRSAVAVIESSNLEKNSTPALNTENFTAKKDVVFTEKKLEKISENIIKDKLSESESTFHTREESANSIKSRDSGVFDENTERKSSLQSLSKSAELNNVTTKPPSAQRSSARKKLLRIDDNAINNSEEPEPVDMNMISRPKSRFGNVAFDLVLDMPETGNMKRKPERLAQIERKGKRSSKKIKTKEEIDRKIQEADERRKIQETEKQIKAKQFQHLSVHTKVQPFQEPSENEDEQHADVNNNQIQNGEKNDI